MVPVYSVGSFLSYLLWDHSTPILLVRDAYESIALTAFFYLLLTYVSPDPAEQRLVFLRKGLSRENNARAIRKGGQPSKWMFPLGFVQSKPRDGLYFLQIMKWGILQYCVIRPVSTLAAVILNYLGYYCEDSWGLGWGHSYITIAVSISVSIAMYCLIQLYFPIKEDLAPHKPLLKLFAIKAVVFLTFWQATLFSVLSMFGVVKDVSYSSSIPIPVGVLNSLITMTDAIHDLRRHQYWVRSHPRKLRNGPICSSPYQSLQLHPIHHLLPPSLVCLYPFKLPTEAEGTLPCPLSRLQLPRDMEGNQGRERLSR